MRRVLPLVLLAVTTAGPAAVAAAAPRPCKGQRGFTCSVLVVPLDHAKPAGPTIRVAFAVQSSAAQRRKPVLVALTGGPGQSGADFGSSFADSLRPLLHRYRLAVIDQRGTGTSGALRCPTLQRQATLAATSPTAVARCGATIGPRRAFYGTRDTVADLDALRLRLGQTKLALMGVSYGTFVAQQYARVHPDRTRALILDSVVGAQIDPFLVDTFARQPRVLREQCLGRRCAGTTNDPVGDVGQVAARINRTGIAGLTFDARGRAQRTAYRHDDELDYLLVQGDLNPYLQAALPAALRAARAGDPALLLRLAPIAAGSAPKVRELSVGLFFATTCADETAPYRLPAPFAARDAATDAALAALDPTAYAPFSLSAVRRGSNARACSRWPHDVVTPPSTAPLPDVPALILGGRLDQRTPVENGAQVAAELPQAQVVTVRGTGHDVLDSDGSGCTRRALTLWVRGKPVGTPCAGSTNALRIVPRPPRSLSALRRVSGVRGARGRLVAAVLDTVSDARLTLVQNLYGGLDAAGGGLRGGSFRGLNLDAGPRDPVLLLRGYAYVPDVRVTGRLTLGGRSPRGTIRVSGRFSGRLALRADGGVTGRVSGRAVRYRPARARGASTSGTDPQLAAVAAALGVPAVPTPAPGGVLVRK